MSETTERSASAFGRIILGLVPLGLFLILSVVFYSLLTTEGRDRSELPSALLNTPAPKLVLPPLPKSGVPGMVANQFDGRVSVVNVFGSWCVPCRQEHPQIMKLSLLPNVQMVGINQRDSDENALKFLEELGNPYDVIGVDKTARASIDWGVYGVPETFLIDQNSIIFYKHVGPISVDDLNNKIIPLLLEKLGKQ